MINTLIEYKEAVRSVESLINSSPYKKSYIIERTGISSPTFYRKLKNFSFTVDEMMSIAKILKPEEFYLYELKKSIEKGKEDLKAGRIQSHEEVLEEIRKEFLQ